MISRTDIQKVSDLPIEQVADALGLTVKKHWSLCPFHNDTHASLFWKVSANKYKCWVCGEYGGPIDLTRRINNQSFHDAVCWLAQTFGIVIDEPYKEFRGVQRREVKPVPKEVSHTFDPCTFAQLIAQPVLTEEAQRFLFDERKLDPRVIEWCKISSTHDNLLIPYFDAEGRLVSVQWRSLHPNPSSLNLPRFHFPKGSQCSIYNLQILKLLKPSEPLWITEGCSDCWAMLSSGRKAIAIPSATLLKPEDLRPLREIASSLSSPLELHMYPDNDAPGEKLFLQLRDLLGSPSPLYPKPSTLVRHQLPSGCKDFAEAYVKMLIC